MRGEYFTVPGSDEIIPLFDPPHLLKGVRNGLLTHDLVCTIDGEQLTASWRHVQQMYAIDCGTTRVAHKLTDFHVIPGKIKKMKVKYCTQVFSYQVAAMLEMLSKLRKFSCWL